VMSRAVGGYLSVLCKGFWIRNSSATQPPSALTRARERTGVRTAMDGPAGRSVDIELNNQEIITIDLDNLDPEPQDVIDLLSDGKPKISIWTKVAAEYWRKGYVEAAEKIAQAAVAGVFDLGPRPPRPQLPNVCRSRTREGKHVCASSGIRSTREHPDFVCAQSTEAYTQRRS
jgi:hypothetical protein